MTGVQTCALPIYQADVAFTFTFSEYENGTQTGTAWYAAGETAAAETAPGAGRAGKASRTGRTGMAGRAGMRGRAGKVGGTGMGGRAGGTGGTGRVGIGGRGGRVDGHDPAFELVHPDMQGPDTLEDQRAVRIALAIM